MFVIKQKIVFFTNYLKINRIKHALKKKKNDEALSQPSQIAILVTKKVVITFREFWDTKWLEA